MGIWDQSSLLANGDQLADLQQSAKARVLLFDQYLRVAADQPNGEQPNESDLFLGVVAGIPWFARRVTEVSNPSNPRKVGFSSTMRQLVTKAEALFNWHDTMPCCENCQAETQASLGGQTRICTSCTAEVFPRIDPAIIVSLLSEDDRLLLAHKPIWKQTRISVLAGFVEAGESAEQTCHREVYEEVGIKLGALRYYGTQPWPYPRALMLAFVALADSTEIRLDNQELAWAQFFTRKQLLIKLDSGELTLPGQASIAARMIQDWLDHNLSISAN